MSLCRLSKITWSDIGIYDLFTRILDMSVMGSIVILVTMLMRFVLRKSSKKYVMVLWVIVALRLLVPVSFESALSVFNYIPHKVFVTEKATESVTAKVNDSMVAPVMAIPAKELVALENHDMVVVPENRVLEKPSVAGINYRMVVAGIWGAGAAAVIGYCVIRFVILKRSLMASRSPNF